MEYLALDTETTGVDVIRDRIIDFVAYRLDDDFHVLQALKQRFNPGMPIPRSATDVHGITDQDVVECPPFQHAASRIQRLTANRTLVAFNGIRFDIPLVDQELRRCGQPGIAADHPVIDPFLLFTEDFPRTLGAAHQYYLGRPHPNPHDAAADVEAMLNVLRVQLARRGLAPHQASTLVQVSDKAWLDVHRRIYVEDGVARFGFGKNKGKPLAEQTDYCRWMLAHDFALDTKRVVKECLGALA